MLAYLPDIHNLLGAVGLAATLALFLACGSAVSPTRTLPEIRLVAGWGLACLVLTVWAVLTPWSLQWPAGALAILALLSLPRCRDLSALWRILLLTVPLWLVMLAARPSQVDTWLNLLPNAAYLFDHNALPTAHGPPNYSFLPLAPYNTQFAAYLASLASGGFADAAMGLFNTALLCGAGLLLGRAAAGGNGTPPWWACAVGLLLAVPLNPGFVPRFFLSPYGEPSLAVTVLFAVWLGAELLDDLAAVAWPNSVVPLALTLAAMVNVKQSGIGLLAAFGVCLLVLALAEPAIPRGRALKAIAATLGPALALYLLWRGYVDASGIPDGELKPLPFAEWNWALLPQIILAILAAMFHAATFFLCAFAVLVFAMWQRHRLLLLTAGTFVLFNGFLLFTYVAHFPPVMALHAHSFFRYNTQVSLLVMLGLIVALRPLIVARLPRVLPSAVIALVLLLPLAGIRLLRFDLDAPQPELWRLGHAVAAYVRPGDRLALLVPNDGDDTVGSFLRGVLLFTPPRRPGLDFRTDIGPEPDALSSAAAAGYHLALVTCAPGNAAALLEYSAGQWRPLRTWPWPAPLKTEHFAALLAREPLCAGPN